MKPSERYEEIRKTIRATHPGIDALHLTEKSLVTLLDELHRTPPEPPKPAPWAGGLPPLPPVKDPK